TLASKPPAGCPDGNRLRGGGGRIRSGRARRGGLDRRAFGFVYRAGRRRIWRRSGVVCRGSFAALTGERDQKGGNACRVSQAHFDSVAPAAARRNTVPPKHSKRNRGGEAANAAFDDQTTAASDPGATQALGDAWNADVERHPPHCTTL